jgi:aryl-alcohol dehydrogenase-like predicted oxidoreductase/predicted kinase
MRLWTDAGGGEETAYETIAAAVGAGITVFDTARAYGRGEHDLGSGERLLAAALRRAGAAARSRIVTKGGMTRPGGGWVPDGRAKSIAADCEASLTALDGLGIDLYLIHAPDPRTPWRTTVRALARLLDVGMVARVGLSNVNRRQLDEALEHVDVAAVEVGLSVYDDRVLRGGILERCEELGIALIAHSPLGGPRRAERVARGAPPLGDAARAAGATPAETALAWLLALSPATVAIPGARRPETARSAAHAARLELTPDAGAVLARAFTRSAPVSRPQAPAARAFTRSAPVSRPQAPGPGSTNPAEVALIMGIPGAGKTRLAHAYESRGYLRLNRDERGGGLRELADELARRLEAGDRHLVLDNTYLSRAARSYVVEAAARHGIGVRCLWLETPLAQAQVNLIERLLDRCGGLPTPEELRALARREPGTLAPTQQMRALRELEPPAPDEGFAALEVIPFVRAPAPPDCARAGVFVAASALDQPDWRRAIEHVDAWAPHLVFDWRADAPPDALAAPAERLQAVISGPVQSALCPHGGGPPRCWCRPPLPGLPLAFAHSHRLDPARCTLIGTSSAHRTLAATLGARYEPVGK